MVAIHNDREYCRATSINHHGCQRNIAAKIIEKKADYVVALKGNQGALREDVEVFAGEQKSVVVVESRREINGKITDETRFYITSLALLAEAVGPMIRAHWAIENSLHWVMDMVFRDDECRVRTDNAPANFATCRHIAYNLTRLRARIPSASGAKPQGGTTSISQASSQPDQIHPIPLPCRDGAWRDW